MTDSTHINHTLALPPAWQRAIQGRRTMLHYKPAALLTVLDMIEAGFAPMGRFDFVPFEELFERRLKSFDAKGTGEFRLTHLQIKPLQALDARDELRLGQANWCHCRHIWDQPDGSTTSRSRCVPRRRYSGVYRTALSRG